MFKILSSNFTVYFILVFYILISSLFITYPGLNFDEVLFEAATFGRSQNYPETMPTFRRKPLFLVAYSGSIKGFLYYPIFKLFGVSILTIRLPMILLSAVSLLFIYKSLLKISNTVFSKLVLLLLVTDIAVFTLIRNDVGPSALEFFFKAISLFFLVKIFIDKGKIFYLFLFISLALGLYNKLNFIWFINALFGCYILYLFYQFWQKRKIYPLIFSLNTIFFGIIYTGYIAFYIYFNKKFKLMRPLEKSAFELAKIKNAVIEVSGKYFDLFTGKSADFFSYDIYQNWAILIGVLIILGIGIGVYDLFLKNASPKKVFVSSFVITLIIVIQQIATSLVRPFMFVATHINPWHIFMVYPFVLICTCYGFYYGLKKHWSGKLAISIIATAKFYMIGCLIYSFANKEPSQASWSSAIYKLKEITDKSDKTIGSIDWGTNAQLHLLANGSNKYLDLYAPCCKDFITTSNKALFAKKYLSKNEEFQFIISADTVANYARAEMRASFFNIIKENNFKVQIVNTITNVHNKPIYYLISVK